MARPGPCSEIVVPDERVLAVQAAQAAQQMPIIGNMNVTKSTKVHVGPKFVSVNQTVENKEMIKDLPLHKYLWHIIKNTTKAERLAVAAGVVAMIIFILLIVYYTVLTNSTVVIEEDVAPHEWNITRKMWLAKNHHWDATQDAFLPLKIVVIGHTAGNECNTFKACAAELRNLQAYLMQDLDWDIMYNFLVGNDGRVYEGLGWNREGAHTRSYNNCTLGVAFMGNYQEQTRVTEAQLNVALRLFDDGVTLGYLDPDFLVVGARDIAASLPVSPGENLYNAIRKWPHFDQENRFRGRTCNQIYGINGI